jgi:hypothetical protein
LDALSLPLSFSFLFKRKVIPEKGRKWNIFLISPLYIPLKPEKAWNKPSV